MKYCEELYKGGLNQILSKRNSQKFYLLHGKLLLVSSDPPCTVFLVSILLKGHATQRKPVSFPQLDAQITCASFWHRR